MTGHPDEGAYRDAVGRRLHARRVWLRLSQDEVARKAEVTRNFVSAIERGAQGLDVWRLGRIADALDVTLPWMLEPSPTLAPVPDPLASSPPARSGAALVDGDRAYRHLIGRRVLLQRLCLERSQDQIANTADLTRNYISAVERGAQGLDGWRLLLLAGALDVTTDWLLDRSTAPITVPSSTITVPQDPASPRRRRSPAMPRRLPAP